MASFRQRKMQSTTALLAFFQSPKVFFVFQLSQHQSQGSGALRWLGGENTIKHVTHSASDGEKHQGKQQNRLATGSAVLALRLSVCWWLGHWSGTS